VALLEALPSPSRTAVEALLAVATRRELAVHLVGGPVRDFLLGRAVHDSDLIVEDGLPGAALALAREALPAARIVAHGRFGTVRIDLPEARVDLATVRSEHYAHPGALPIVAAGSLEDDLQRRDFSVNALAVPLTPRAREGRGAVIDLAHGQDDLRARTLRILHEKSFQDDPTRALRAGRLAARLGFTFSRGSRAALRDALRDGVFGRVSGDRLRRELEKLFDDAALGADPSRVLRLLDEWHVLAALEPGLRLPRAAVVPLRRLGRMLSELPWPSPRLRGLLAGLAVWLAPLDAGLRQRALQRISVRGEVAARIAAFPRARDVALRELTGARGRGAIDAVLGKLGDEELLALLAYAAPTPRRRILRYAIEDRSRRLPVSGDDLLALGLSGPVVGRALARIRAGVLDGVVRSRDDALALARELGRRRAPSAAPRRAPSAAPRTRIV
jgi:tRNA nucleotidyltransferase (CCA-adding enzyme)